MYLSWFIRYVLVTKIDIRPKTQVGFFIDVLSSVILLSLFSVLILYPLDYWTVRIWSSESLSQINELFGIHASYIFLQGLFLFRLVEISSQGEGDVRFFRAVFTMQACTIVAFSGYQAVFGNAGWLDARSFNDRGIHFPFDDIHSYGSYLIVLFSVFLFSIRGAPGNRKWVNGGLTLLLGLWHCPFFFKERLSCAPVCSCHLSGQFPEQEENGSDCRYGLCCVCVAVHSCA